LRIFEPDERKLAATELQSRHIENQHIHFVILNEVESLP
jgi:hypothetical protein